MLDSEQSGCWDNKHIVSTFAFKVPGVLVDGHELKLALVLKIFELLAALHALSDVVYFLLGTAIHAS